ncbi:PREDICTED: vacuolar ATPase assembly integral membrane protein vma21-like [Nicrophorus vespilloides]|uniref:Vacuolar ATPase assembly integral membrane protein vma21-like n=1 Tax=Nicrophorus vespilloides TaxID=110193 RepID=A0ABM1MZ62_NICVS|nr:PREDICTED: vacuolar ATPase assembly integral membrane protein vma21-like [Nicrophorus vespilloides]
MMSTDEPFIPEHTKQASKAVLMLLFYSTLMFTIPFGAFFAVRNILFEYGVVGFTNTVWSVLTAVICVNFIICLYAYQAYHEQEYDDDGKEINTLEEKKTD